MAVQQGEEDEQRAEISKVCRNSYRHVHCVTAVLAARTRVPRSGHSLDSTEAREYAAVNRSARIVGHGAMLERCGASRSTPFWYETFGANDRPRARAIS
jgi:hypothetical protein